MHPHDPFALSFDSIEIDPTRAPAREAIERAMAHVAGQSPGFYLADDGGGRFIVDRDTGVISLAGEDVLARERGAIIPARLRVVEASGQSYELDLHLRITGLIPHMAGAEDILAGFTPADAPEPAAPAIAPAPVAAPKPVAAPWARYAAFTGGAATAAIAHEAVPFGALRARLAPPAAPGPFQLTLPAAPPAPTPKQALWPA